MRKLMILGMLLLTGCGAHMVNTRGPENAYAPVNEGQGGTVRYLANGAGSVVKARRQSAYKQMHQRCGGSYRIVSESTRGEDGIATPMGGSVVYGQSQYNYIEFECEAK